MAKTKRKRMALKVEFDRETDGRWIAEIPALPGVLVYGDSRKDAERKVMVLALRVLADRAEDEKQSLSPLRALFAQTA
jgi:predicted RNase H-like HicB family nuclease